MKQEPPFSTTGKRFGKTSSTGSASSERAPPRGGDERAKPDRIQRRFENECGSTEKKGCITVERSDAYDGLKPGYLVIVGGLAGDDAKERLTEVRRVVKDAYLVETSVYRGCIH